MTPCTDILTDYWTSDDPQERMEAAELCVPCPVREACLAGAMERREAFGVWASVDFSYGTRTTSFACGILDDRHGCAASPVGIGRRVDRQGERLVPACEKHLLRAMRVTVLEPVPRPVPDVERTLGAAS